MAIACHAYKQTQFYSDLMINKRAHVQREEDSILLFSWNVVKGISCLWIHGSLFFQHKRKCHREKAWSTSATVLPFIMREFKWALFYHHISRIMLLNTFNSDIPLLKLYHSLIGQRKQTHFRAKKKNTLKKEMTCYTIMLIL